MKVVIASDHRGHSVLDRLTDILQSAGHAVDRLGVCHDKSCDYPDSAYPVALAVAQGTAERGILVCGSGIGMSIAANKVPGVRAALVNDEIGAEMSRRHNDANVLCLSADLLGGPTIEKIVHKWMSTPFEGGRHARRVAKIAAIEQGLSPATVVADHGEASAADVTAHRQPLGTARGEHRPLGSG